MPKALNSTTYQLPNEFVNAFTIAADSDAEENNKFTIIISSI